MIFSGLIYFRNDVKPTSPPAVLQLRLGKIKSVMITGDNVWTGKGVVFVGLCGVERIFCAELLFLAFLELTFQLSYAVSFLVVH